jgi:hypothetical protein
MIETEAVRPVSEPGAASMVWDAGDGQLLAQLAGRAAAKACPWPGRAAPHSR